MSPTQSKIAYLGLGSNLGEREKVIEEALHLVDILPGTTLLRRSPFYESKPWGKLDQPDFLNMVAEVSTTLSPQSLLRHLKQIEAEQGRVAAERWGPRPIDIDILMYDDVKLRTPTLTIPHERMWQRQFVLRPLADLIPDLSSPDGTPIRQFLMREEIATQGVHEYNLERHSDDG